MMECVRLGRNLPLESIAVSALCVYTETDEVVSIPAIKEMYARLGSTTKRLIDLPGAERHILAGDIISPDTTDALIQTVLEFLEEIS